MECSAWCACSRLHPDGTEALITGGSLLPPEVLLSGKLEVLDRMLVKLMATGHKVCTLSLSEACNQAALAAESAAAKPGPLHICIEQLQTAIQVGRHTVQGYCDLHVMLELPYRHMSQHGKVCGFTRHTAAGLVDPLLQCGGAVSLEYCTISPIGSAKAPSLVSMLPGVGTSTC